jgi:CBS domain containing-hemolysin-like protein
MNPHASLPTQLLDPGAALVQAQPWHATPVTLESPALEVMTDLTRVKAAHTAPGTSLRQAEQLMIHQGVRMLFVTPQMPGIEGLVTTTDLSSDKVLRVVQQRGLHFDELTVADVMTPQGQLDAIDIAAMRSAAVANVVATFKRLGRNHLLVLEHGEGPARQNVRGVISRSQVERQLGQLIEMTEVANSFADVERLLA